MDELGFNSVTGQYGTFNADGSFTPLDPSSGYANTTSGSDTTSSGNTGSWGSQSTPQEWLTGIGAIFQGAGSLFSAIKYQPNPSGGGGYVATPQSESTQKFIGIAVVILVLIVTIIIIRKIRK
jgi:hypothetical protein